MNNIILIGNPNTGKTTLFNTLTKSNEKASNWHGVTVGSKCKNYIYHGKEFTVTDLPGLYSINAYSNEEKIAAEYLEEHKEDVIVNICDANNLKRNLRLTLELLNKNYKVIVVVNMAKEVKSLDYDKLSKFLNTIVIPIDARKKQSVDKIKKLIDNYYEKKLHFSSICDKNQLNISELDDFLKLSNYNNSECYKITDKIDKIVLNKFVFLPLFLIVIFLVFYLTFGPFGSFILSIFDCIFKKIFDILRNLILCINMSNIIKVFLTDGVINSLQTVIGFAPQIALLMFFLNFLEDIGFMSRVAFMFDGLLKKLGLTGKSLFSLMMGFGCTTSAVMTTRNLENNNLRKRTVLLLPFMSCTAKLPVFLVVSSLFFDKYKYLFVFGLYLLAIVLSIIVALIYNKIIPSKKNVFILEMPKYRLPNLKKVALDSLSVVKEFLVKVGTTILFFSVFVWILQNFSFSFKYLGGQNFSNSMLFSISNFLLPLFKFIGIDSAGMVAALLFGVLAKEMVIVGLAMINGVSGSISLLSASLISETSICYFTPTSSVVFLIFVLIYSPCISAIAMIKNEFGFKTACYVFVFQFVLAFLVCFVIYQITISRWLIYVLLSVIVLDILIAVVLKFRHKKSDCRGQCNACRKVCG